MEQPGGWLYADLAAIGATGALSTWQRRTAGRLDAHAVAGSAIAVSDAIGDGELPHAAAGRSSYVYQAQAWLGFNAWG